MKLEHVNLLPVRTWNWLGVNETSWGAPDGMFGPYRKEYITGRLPEGVEQSEAPFPIPAPESNMGTEADKFVREHRNCGVSLRVRAGARPEEPVLLSCGLDEENPAAFDVTEIAAEEGSEVTVIMTRFSGGSTAGVHGGLTQLYAGKDAVIRLIQLQTLGDGCVHFDAVSGITAENGEIRLIQAELGGKSALSGAKIALMGKKSRFLLDAVYFGDGERSLDFNYVAEHTGKGTESQLLANGALLDESRKIFRGTIDFKRGAKGAKGRESEYNLLFSPRARNRTAPLILCQEEDVEGQHAATVGRVDGDLLFYLMARGLSELEAKKLVIEARFHPALEQIPDEGLRENLLAHVKERLDKVESISE